MPKLSRTMYEALDHVRRIGVIRYDFAACSSKPTPLSTMRALRERGLLLVDDSVDRCGFVGVSLSDEGVAALDSLDNPIGAHHRTDVAKKNEENDEAAERIVDEIGAALGVDTGTISESTFARAVEVARRFVPVALLAIVSLFVSFGDASAHPVADHSAETVEHLFVDPFHAATVVVALVSLALVRRARRAASVESNR